MRPESRGLAGALSGALGSLGAGPLFAQAGQALGQQNGSAQMPRERDIEALLASCKKDTESLEKKLMGLVKKKVVARVSFLFSSFCE